MSGASDARRSVTNVLLRLTLFAVPLAFTTLTFNQFLLPQSLLLKAMTATTVASALLWLGSEDGGGWRRSIDVPVLVLGVALLLGTAWSINPRLSWRGEYLSQGGTWTQLQGLLLFFVTAQAVRTWAERAAVIEAIVLAGLVQGTYVLVQACALDFVTADLSFASIGRFDGTSGNPLIAAAVLAAVLPLAAVLLLSAQGAVLRRRAIATGMALLGGSAFWLVLALLRLGGARSLEALRASVTEPALWVLAGGLVCATAQVGAALWGRGNLARWLAVAGSTAVLVRALTETGSRSAVLAAGLALPVAALAAWWSARGETGSGSASRRATKIVTAAALSLVAVLAVSVATSSSRRVVGSLGAPFEAIAQSRSNIWQPALAMWRERPITGWGVDTFMRLFPAFETPFRPAELGELQVPQNAHSEPLMLLASVGVVGLAAWLAVVGSWAVGAWRRLRAERAADERWIEAGCIAAVLTLLLYGLAGLPSPTLQALFWVLLAISVTPRAGRAGAWAIPAAARWVAGGALVVATLVPAVQTFRADLFYKAAFVALRKSDALRFAPPDRALAAGAAALADAPPSDALLEARRSALAAAQTPLEDALRKREPRSLQAASRFATLALGLEAAALQERAVALVPSEPQYRWYLGEVLARSYEAFPEDEAREAWFLRARSAYEAAIARSGRDAFSSASLARLHVVRWNVERDSASAAQARRLYAETLRQAPLVRPFLRDAVAAEVAAGHPDAGVALLSELSLRAPEVAVAILQSQLATPAICAQERAPACREIVRRALARDPVSAPARSVARALEE